MSNTLGIIIALISLIGSIVALLFAKRSTYINTVTTERIRWTQELKENISTYCTKIHFSVYESLGFTDIEQMKKFNKLVLEEIKKYKILIKINLNLAHAIHKKLDTLIDELDSIASKLRDLHSYNQRQKTDYLKQKANYKEFNEKLDEVIQISQQLFNAVWEEVEREANDSKFWRWYLK